MPSPAEVWGNQGESLGRLVESVGMNWREFITSIYEARPPQPGYATKPQFYAGVAACEVAEAEVRLNVKLPASLRSLLLDTNGVMEMMAIDGGEWFQAQWVAWTLSRVVEENLLSCPWTETYDYDFHRLVFFGDAGSDGILFGFPVMEDRVCSPPRGLASH